MSSPPATARPTVVLDLGGVLIDWDPRHLYRKLMPADEIDAFLAEIGFTEWNHAHDAGQPWAEGVRELAQRHPARRALIEAYPARYAETMAGPVPGTVALLGELHDRGTRLLALTNWSAETFPHARASFGFLSLFDGIVVSGAEGLAKPDPRLFQVLVERYGVLPADCVYVDDSAANVRAAGEVGFDAVLFEGAGRLRDELSRRGLVDAAAPG